MITEIILLKAVFHCYIKFKKPHKNCESAHHTKYREGEIYGKKSDFLNVFYLKVTNKNYNETVLHAR